MDLYKCNLCTQQKRYLPGGEGSENEDGSELDKMHSCIFSDRHDFNDHLVMIAERNRKGGGICLRQSSLDYRWVEF